MINFQNVSKQYNSDKPALTDVSFKIAPKEFVSIVGPSGAGKSTIVKLLIAEEQPTRGRITFGHYDVSNLKPADFPKLRRHIGVVFQDFRLLTTKTAHENIAFALEVAGRPNNEIGDLVEEVLDLVGLGDKGNSFMRELSGGEKQRVAIARAMVSGPDVIVADEPTGNLDPINTLEIVNLLTQINELGTTIILATHDKEVVNQLSKRVIVLENGRVVRDDEKGRYTTTK